MPRINRIRIKEVDHTLSSKGGRVLEVTAGSHSFNTPTRPFTVAEITAKSYLGYRGVVQSDIAALPVDFSGKRKELFLKNNGALHAAETALQSKVDASRAFPSMPVMQIDPFDSGDMFAFKLAFEMQRSIDGLDILSMPEMRSDKSSFDRMVGNWSESSEEAGFGTAVHLALSEDVDAFAEKLDILADYSKTGAVQVLNIRYANPELHKQQLAALWLKRDDLEAIVNCTEMRSPRSESSSKLVQDEETLLLQNGFDTVTKKKITPSQQFVKKLASMPPIDSLEEIDQFKIHRHDASASIKSTTWTKMEHPPECHCSMCRGDDREKLFDRFGYLDDGSISKSGMRHFSILHDHQSDIDELEIFRRYTASGGTAEYDERVESNLSELRKLTRVRDRLRYRVPTTSSNRPWR